MKIITLTTLSLLMSQTMIVQSYELSKKIDKHNIKKRNANKGAPTISTVGSDGQCTHTNIQDAIDSSNEVRIASNGSPYFESITISVNDATVVKGGYANCTDALNNITDLSRPIIDGGGDLNDVFDIRINDEISVSNLIIGHGRRGIWMPPNNSTVLNLNNVRLFNNFSSGILVSGDDNQAFITNSTIDFNSSSGVSCSGDSEVFIYGDTLIEKNSNLLGGGIKVKNNCSLSVLSPTVIQDNMAQDAGGGIYVENGANVSILSGSFTCDGLPCGSNTQPISIMMNNGDSDSSAPGQGGGVFVEGQNSSVIALNVLFENNQAQYGGAVFTDNEATFYADSFLNGNEGCWNTGSCSQFRGNKAQSGGVIAVYGNSSATINKSKMKQNRANGGVIAYIFNGQEVLMNNNMVFDNGDPTHEDYFDASLWDNDGGSLVLEYQTVANNHLNHEVIENYQGSLKVVSSIISENVDVYDKQDDTTEQFECLIVHETDSFSAGGTVIIETPLFVNPTYGDYRNQPTSPAIDYCYDVSASNNSDIEGNLHGSDYAYIDNLHGVYDLGADEFIIENDIIYKNGFEQD